MPIPKDDSFDILILEQKFANANKCSKKIKKRRQKKCQY